MCENNEDRKRLDVWLANHLGEVDTYVGNCGKITYGELCYPSLEDPLEDDFCPNCDLNGNTITDEEKAELEHDLDDEDAGEFNG
jgi:hypothetical protein